MMERIKNIALIILTVLLIVSLKYEVKHDAATYLQINKHYSKYVEQYRRISLRPHALVAVQEELISKQIILLPDEIKIDQDRREWLKGLVLFVVDKYETKKDKAIAWTIFLQHQIYHSNYSPILYNKIAIFDPKWIIENRIAHCDQTNRIIVDGLNLIDIMSRLVQLNGHVVAESYWNDKWHYLDADAIGFSQVVTNSNNEIPSVLEIMDNPNLVDGVRYYEEEIARACLSKATFGPASRVFNRAKYSGRLLPFAYIKTATQEQEKNMYYGWNYYDTVQIWK